MAIRNSVGDDSIVLDGARGSVGFADWSGKRVIFLDPNSGPRNEYSALFLGEGKAGMAVLRDSLGHDSITLDGGTGYINIRDNKGNDSIVLNGNNNSMVLRDEAGRNSIVLDGTKGNITMIDKNGKTSYSIESTPIGSNIATTTIGSNTLAAPKAGLIRLCDPTGHVSIVIDGYTKNIRFPNRDGIDSSVFIDGERGDIMLNNADCAEDFDILESEEIQPGTVMVIENEGKLRQSRYAYDKRVAGIISGAGDCKPAIVLDKKHLLPNRKPLALMGKVFCKVDCESSSIDAGDLLTSSDTPGHAMKAIDPSKTFGAVIGKALRSLKAGKGLIPILITLQ